MTGEGEASATRHAITFAGIRLAAWTLGAQDAPVLVVCHGGALDHSGFLAFAEQWSARHRVILWDLPGHGQSQALARPLTADACAAAMAAVMDQLAARDAVAIGFSFGGVVAQIAAKARPDLVHRLIAYGCFSPHVGAPLVAPLLVRPLVAGLFAHRSWSSIRKRFAQLCCVTPAGQAQVERDMMPVGKAGFMAMARANLLASDRDPAWRIPGGVDLIAGALDSNGASLWRTFEAFEAAYPAARKILIADAGHCAHLDQPEAFASAIGQLLQ